MTTQDRADMVQGDITDIRTINRDLFDMLTSLNKMVARLGRLQDGSDAASEAVDACYELNQAAQHIDKARIVISHVWTALEQQHEELMETVQRIEEEENAQLNRYYKASV